VYEAVRPQADAATGGLRGDRCRGLREYRLSTVERTRQSPLRRATGIAATRDLGTCLAIAPLSTTHPRKVTMSAHKGTDGTNTSESQGDFVEALRVSLA
jgi:hypothetical protein